MPEMLATARTPYLGLPDFQSPPRIISEIKKPTPAWPRDNARPRITGELLCYSPSEGCWRTKRVAVRSGQLLVGSPGDQNPRLALRRLNLTPGPATHSFALRRSPDTQPLLTFQASNQREFDNWVRTIAIELIRQTPLDAIKYLDIFTLTPPVTPTKTEPVKDYNHNCLINIQENIKKEKFDENKNIYSSNESITTNNRLTQPRHSISDHRLITQINNKLNENRPVDEDEQTVELLLKKCQNSDSYVPVKEKLKLFESLCRLGKNNEDVVNNVKYTSKRTRSLHDLSHSENSLTNTNNNPGVKQICKYFETKNHESKSKEIKFNTIARTHRTSFGPVKNLIGRKYSVQPGKY